MDIRTPVPTIYGSLADKYKNIWAEQVQKIQENFGDAIEPVLMPIEAMVDMPTLVVKASEAHRLIAELKQTHQYSFLTDFTAVDEQEEDEKQSKDFRFFLVFHLMNPESKARIRVKIKLKDGENIQTFTGLWEGANWAEREIYDMFGIRFEGHPDLRRILMDMRWEGHPLRKDYPLRGYQIFLTPEPLDPELLK